MIDRANDLRLIEAGFPCHQVGAETIGKIKERFKQRGMFKLGEQQDIDLVDVEEILTSRI